MSAEPCRRVRCAGMVEDGYCTMCGHAPQRAAQANSSPTRALKPTSPPPIPAGGKSKPAPSPGSRTSEVTFKAAPQFAQSSANKQLGADLVQLPELPLVEPESAVLQTPEVPEHRRICARCEAPVRREVGFCGQCGARYSFVAVLGRGDVVAGQYEVKGPIAFGGLGWIYLAFDRLLMRYVVLKGLLNAQDSSAAAAAVAERQFLAAVRHPDIVDIYNFVQASGEGFIVMEYIGGKTLKQIRQERGPLPPAEAIAYILRILPALSYLHRRGLVLCDFKPDNVMVEHDSVKLIDLGAVRHVGDPHGDIYGTVGYSAPEAGEGPTPSSDLFTIGRTLAVLLMNIPRFASRYRYRLPEPDEVPLFAQHESLYRFLLRATAESAAERFTNADAMAEQLLGVLREVVACNSGSPRPGLSLEFGADPLSLDAGDAVEPVRADPFCLPTPTLDAGDPAGQVVSLALAMPDPRQRAAALENACRQMPASLEARLRLAAAHLQTGELERAQVLLNEAARVTSRPWRVLWFGACTHLICQRYTEALEVFHQIFLALPGELAPKLGLALTAELQGNFLAAAKMYDLVSRVDPSHVSAAFGLARCERRKGDKYGAVAALRRIPASSALYVRARVEAARTLLQTEAHAPGLAEVRAACELAQSLHLKEQDRLRLDRDVFQAALRDVMAKPPVRGSTEKLLGQAVTQRALRAGLERTLRRMARFAEGQERIRLVDEANRVRPRTLF